MSYDEVDFKMDCPKCSKEITGFQTKDLSCDFEKIDYWECNNFYSSCHFCDTWVEFNRKEKLPKVPINHYSITVEEKEGRWNIKSEI